MIYILLYLSNKCYFYNTYVYIKLLNEKLRYELFCTTNSKVL